AHTAEEEARRVYILCDDRQAVIDRLQGECVEVEEDRRAQREERERLAGKLHQVFDEWSAAQEKWDTERISLQSQLVGLESELERRQAEVEEVRESLAALARQGGASDGEELTLTKRVHQLTARVLSLSRLEYDARARAERLSIAHDASERRATRLEEAIGRVRAQLRHSEQQRGTLELKISEKGVLEKETEHEGCLSADAMEEANAKLRAHIDEMARLHKCQVERMLSQVGSFERGLEAISQTLPEFTPPTALDEVLSGMPGKPDVGELLLATAERLWKEEAKAQRLQTLLERWWRNWRCSEEALMALVAHGPSGVVSKEGARWKGMRDTNRLLRESLGKALAGWHQCRVELAVLSRSMQSDKTPRKDEEERASTERPISPGVAVDDGSAEAVYKKALEGITTRLLDYSRRIDSLRSENNMLKERLGAERKLHDPEAERILNEEDPRLRQLLEKFSLIEMTLSSMAVELDKENVTAPPVVASHPSSVSLEVMASGDDIEEVISARVEVECRKMRVLRKGELARARIDLEKEITELQEKLEAERAVSAATIEGHAAESSRLKLQMEQLRKRLAVCMEAVSVEGSESDALVALQSVCGELARFERGEADLSQKDDGPTAAASPSKTDKRKLKRILAAQRQVILLLQGSSPSTPNEGVAVERALLRVLIRIQQSVESTISSTTKKGRSPNSISSADLRLLLTACEAMARDISKKTTTEHHRCAAGEEHQKEEPKEAEAARDKEIERLVESRVQEHVHRYDAVLRRVEVMAEQQRLMHRNTVEELLREQLETIRKRLELSEEEREAAEHRATNLEGTLVQERDKSAATIEQLRQLLFQKDDVSGTPPRGRLLSPSTQHSEDKSSGDQVLLERNSVSLQHYQAEKLEHSRRSEAALLVLQSKDETIAKLREEKEAVSAEKSQWEEEKRKMLEQNAAMQTRFDSLLTESARLQAEVHRLQELNDAAANEFEVLRSAEASARRQVGALQRSVVNHQREVADLRAELARMKRSTTEAGVQTEASRPRGEELLEENSVLKKEVDRLAKELESREKQQQKQANTESTPPADQQALHNLRGQLAELSIEIQRCKFAEKEAIRQRDVAVADLEAELSRQHPPQSTSCCQTCEELEVTWPVKEFLRGVDRVENSEMVAELRKEVHTAEQARYDLLVRSQAELKSLTARAHTAEEEARRVHILCDDRQAAIGRLQGECAELEEGRRAQREERERLSGKLHQVFDEWSAAQEKWDAERVSLQSKLVGLETELERRQAEVEEARESLAAL
ncbi:hypothetical protein FOZ63_031410, partial [Perkinsus olseni]